MKNEAAPIGPGVVLRVGELFLKGRNRFRFEEALACNVRRAVADRPDVEVVLEHGRIFALGACDTDSLASLASVFGVASLSPALFCEKGVPPITEAALALTVGKTGPARTFRIAARRSDKRFPLKSTELAREVGAAVQRATGLGVDLTAPDLTVGVEVGPRWAFVWAQELPGAGGLPVGTSGRALLLLSGGIDSPCAGHLMQKRGLKLAAVYFHAFPYTGDGARDKVVDLARVLARRQGPLRLFVVPFARVQEALRDNAPGDYLVVLYRRAMLRIACRLAKREGLPALVTGESLGQVASQTLANIAAIEDAASLPVLRPLIGFDKLETVGLARTIGTYDISIRPHMDCCSLFVPPHPITKGSAKQAAFAESRVDLAPLMDEAVAASEVSDL
ncbi:MAG: tRNA 4-thiouridine(8) synthase ThiI [Deltaproteobacteria bacterium]|nr:tRNA 4-thiouridine(8) synthase ThiI [Deltaproteobacteria bacterium]